MDAPVWGDPTRPLDGNIRCDDRVDGQQWARDHHCHGIGGGQNGAITEQNGVNGYEQQAREIMGSGCNREGPREGTQMVARAQWHVECEGSSTPGGYSMGGWSLGDTQDIIW